MISVILCGGAGSRLWPVSRELHPKPFIRLDDGQSLLQKAFLRGSALPDVTEVLTVTNREILFKTEDAYAEVNDKGVALSYILEPFGRNTAAAIALAALYVEQHHGGDEILLTLAADHLITDEPEFGHAVDQAQPLARDGKLVAFGIQPTSVETGYGYIEYDGNAVLRFVEKPTLEKAQDFLTSGRFLWNSGMFCFSVSTILAEMNKYCPEILTQARSCMSVSKQAQGVGMSFLDVNADVFRNVPENSVDYAVMEHSQCVAVVPCNIGWSDIGSWQSLGDLTPKDVDGNRVHGDAILHETRNCIIQERGHHRMVGVVGVDNLIIVDTEDRKSVV